VPAGEHQLHELGTPPAARPPAAEAARHSRPCVDRWIGSLQRESGALIDSIGRYMLGLVLNYLTWLPLGLRVGGSC
jgi:hypothetical protein